MTNALAGIVLTVFGSRIGRSMFRQQATNQGGAIFIGAPLQAIGIAAKKQAHKLQG